MSPSESLPRRDRWSQWAHCAVVALLLAFAASLDYLRPYSRTYSICYLLPALYGGWALRGKYLIVAYLLAFTATFLVPSVRNPADRKPVSFNRVMGATVGLVVAVLMYERRRYADALAEAKRDLERKVQDRTTELQALNREYERLIAVKGQFLSNMSHEIRTPLNGVIGMTELLQYTPLTDEQRGIVRDLEHSGEALRAIVNNILDLSRIEAGRLELEQAAFSIGKTVAEVAAILRPEAMRKRIDLRTVTPGPHRDSVIGDHGRVRQVLINLAANALKFTESGFVRIQVDCLESNAEAALVRFAVHDSGIGIAPEAQRQIFEKFTQADASTTRRYGGSGLGLAISKELVQLMKGTIGVDSRVGDGATFWFTLRLPLAQAPVSELHPSRVPAGVPPGPSVRVAVVEDNEVNRKLAAKLLEKLGCQVELASNGKEALDIMERSTVDVAFLDCHMPEMDGFETTRAIRQRESATGRRTVVIAMTASAMEGDRERCLAAGMDDYLAKPVSMTDLQKALLRWTGPDPVLPA